MPQKTRKEKERAAMRRGMGQIKTPVAPAPIEMPLADREMRISRSLPSPAARRLANPPMAQPQPALNSEFNYSYVYSDLRRIALLAVLCFGIMIALVFVLNR